MKANDLCNRDFCRHLRSTHIDENGNGRSCGSCRCSEFIEASATRKAVKTKKLRYDLIPPTAERLVVKVLNFGANKHGANDWRNDPDWRKTFYNAARRHIADWLSGEILDPESGLPHMACATTNLMFITEKEAEIKPDFPASITLPICGPCATRRDHGDCAADRGLANCYCLCRNALEQPFPGKGEKPIGGHKFVGNDEYPCASCRKRFGEHAS